MGGRRSRQTDGQEEFLFSVDLAEFEEPVREGARHRPAQAQGSDGEDVGSRETADGGDAAVESDAVSEEPAGTGGEDAAGRKGIAPATAPRTSSAGGHSAGKHPASGRSAGGVRAEIEEGMTRAEIAAFDRTGPEYLLDRARRTFHRALLDERVLVTRPGSGAPSNADAGSGSSLRYARAIVRGIGAVETHPRAAGQGASRSFERAVAAYLQAVLPALDAVRPGDWSVRRLGDPGAAGDIEDASEIFEQYEHVAGLRELVQGNRELRAVLGFEAELLAPDVVVARAPVTDADFNAVTRLVDPLGPLASASPLRRTVQAKPLLHAVVSCKWTLRSDRAQQARAEAQQLIRNRRGRAPHLVMVTGEPMPSRIAAVALGTGELDCVYHFALHELMDAVDPAVDPAGAELMHTMVQGRRLRDISDLPLDLAV